MRSRSQTAKDIYELAKEFYPDLLEFKDYTLEEFYNVVQSVPFGMDEDYYSPQGEHWEVVPRPAYILNRDIFPFIDCKKKTILLSAFFELKGWDYLLTATSEHEGDPHHIFILLWTGDDWQAVDATKEDDYLFKLKPEVVHGEIFWP